ncbi:MAG: TIGR00730 family Rossman fold protein [Flavobacteriales bacterium]|nr:TIGR00730 family Rossman fold protein [Flavobacteriales bacterium]
MENIAVFCGSSTGSDPKYIQAAQEMGAEMARQGIGLVYGGGKAGLMGTVADAVLDGGGNVYGVIPDRVVQAERAHRGITKLYVVESMHARKSLMAQLADGFVALPGGLGTLDELFEILTRNQLGIINKPVGLLNVDGYYDPLLDMVDHIAKQGFLHALKPEELLTSGSVVDLIDQMKSVQ